MVVVGEQRLWGGEGGEWKCLCGGSDWTTYSLVVGTSITF